MKVIDKKLIAIILCSIIFLSIFETYISLNLRFPSLFKFGTSKIVCRIYDEQYQNIIQFDSECARYDPELTYILKPGIFHFSNSEFNNVYKVNSAGLRDDESSLIKPDIIVLGDSVAMGWGVAQSETYSKIIERKCNLRVLNAAVSSYATVREMRLLNRLDTSNLKYLIIHYASNDYDENKQFYKHNNVLKISSEWEYNKVKEIYLKQKRYYPGKYAILSFKYLVEKLRSKIKRKYKNSFRPLFLNYKNPDSAKFFVNAIIKASHINLGSVTIIVVARKDNFIARLKDEISHAEYPDYIRKIIAISVASNLTPDTHFLLDYHLTAKGHEIIADEIIKVINLHIKK